jgi:hypothetical protein
MSPLPDPTLARAACAALLLAVIAAPPALAADAFAPAGAKALLSVELRFESAGRRQDRIDLFEWRGRRVAIYSVPLVAQAPQPVSPLRGPDAAQQAQLLRAQQAGQRAATAMAPMMASVQQIVARCGDDEACITRETQKLGFSMSGSPQVAEGGKAVDAAVAAGKPGAPRYQLWQGDRATGRYEVDETMHAVHGDPICMSLPRQRCTRDESRRGAGPLGSALSDGQAVVAGPAEVEFDSVQHRLSVQLPGWLVAPVKDAVRTDEPAGTHETDGLVWLRSPDLGGDAVRDAHAFSVPLAGAVTGASGERRLVLAGADGAGGTLVLRWKLEPR